MGQWPAAAHQGLITLPPGLPTADPTRFLRPLERLGGWPPGVHCVLLGNLLLPVTPVGWFLPPRRTPRHGCWMVSPPPSPGAGGELAAAAEAGEWEAPGQEAPDELTARPPWGKQGFLIHLLPS